MKFLHILNGPAYGDEHNYTAVRLAQTQAMEELDVIVFLAGDAVTCAAAGQRTPSGFYNFDVMLRSIMKHGGEVYYCGTCADARGIDNFVAGTERGTMVLLSELTETTDKILTW